MEDVQKHLMALQQRGLAVSSIARHLATIKVFLRFLLAERVLRRDGEPVGDAENENLDIFKVTAGASNAVSKAKANKARIAAARARKSPASATRVDWTG